MNRTTMYSATLLLGCFGVSASLFAQSPSETQKVNLTEKIKVPGGTLKPGDYTIAVEDRLQDRAIVRITNDDGSQHFLILAVPNAKLAQAGSDGLIRFTNAKGKDEALRGWACPGCSPGLEFVYPKAEAAKLTDETAEPVVAVDPTYDKLPGNLSPDDMKVVTLWLLAPETITANNKGKGVKAAKWATVAPAAPATEVASAQPTPPANPPAEPAPATPAPASASSSSDTSAAATTPAPEPAGTATASARPAPAAPVASAPDATASSNAVPAAPATELASNSNTRSSSRLPKTASNDYLYVFAGIASLAAWLGLRLARRSSSVA